jgi:dihydrofolate synthase / folylpolyglutamate synthase
MTYNEAIEYIHETYKFGSKLGLENILKLLSLMGDPHKKVKVIHVAGTNGKGSTSSIITKILAEAKLNVGFYSSPYLEVFNERIRLNGENISNEDLAEVTGFTKEAVDKMVAEGYPHPTEFEVVTAIAFEYYMRKAVDVVVLEVGLGGRLDSTNVCDNPLVSVITPIDYDHVDMLGETLAEIAGEKAGIIKQDSICVIHPQLKEAEDVIIKRCAELNTRLVIAPTDMINITKYDEFGSEFTLNDNDYKLGLLGEHQTRNAAVAITVANALRESYEFEISDEDIRNGLMKATWPGRLEVIGRRPTVIIDGAHNLHGAKGLAHAVSTLFNGRKVIAVVGILADKDYKGILDEMMPYSNEVIVTEPNNFRKMPAVELAEAIRAYGKAPMIEPSIKSAIDRSFAIAGPDDVILFFGSLYMIGDARTILKSILL